MTQQIHFVSTTVFEATKTSITFQEVNVELNTLVTIGIHYCNVDFHVLIDVPVDWFGRSIR